MRVFIGIRSTAVASFPVPLTALGGSVDNDVELERANLLLELETGDLGTVTLAWLGREGGSLESVPLPIVDALLGPDSADRRMALLEMAKYREACELTRPVGHQLMATGGAA